MQNECCYGYFDFWTKARAGQNFGIFKFFIKETPQKLGAGEFFMQLLDLPHPGPGG